MSCRPIGAPWAVRSGTVVTGKPRNEIGAEVLIAPATPRSATTIGEQIMEINGEPLPVRASMGMLTQPISFLGLPVTTLHSDKTRP